MCIYISILVVGMWISDTVPLRAGDQVSSPLASHGRTLELQFLYLNLLRSGEPDFTYSLPCPVSTCVLFSHHFGNFNSKVFKWYFPLQLGECT